VPAFVDAQTWDRAQAQLARNAALSFRNNTKHNYLLRCLMTCSSCGLAMFGRTYIARGRQPERRYYMCHGKDCIMSARPAACPSRNVKADEIEAAVWGHVAELLASPDRMVAQFDRFSAAAESGTTRDRAADQRLRARLDRVARADKRLLDAYQAGAISLAELSERRRHLHDERLLLERQQREADELRRQRVRPRLSVPAWRRSAIEPARGWTPQPSPTSRRSCSSSSSASSSATAVWRSAMSSHCAPRSRAATARSSPMRNCVRIVCTQHR
jgi:site-specific DNA recombinase